MEKTAIIIPARYGSSRLEGKPLIKVLDKPIIQWVWEKAKKTQKADMVIVATDDERIFNTVNSFGGYAEMTSVEHKSGSDRIAEVALRHPVISFIVNLQGDEPLISLDDINAVIDGVKNDKTVDISTLVREINDEKEANNPNLVKCVFDINNYALYFSRSKIPFERNSGMSKIYGHLGIYGYRKESLLKMTQLSQTNLEKAESLEQLRALQHGMRIKVSVTENVPVGIDTIDDLEHFKQLVQR